MLGPELVSLGKRGGRGATLTLEVHMSHPVVCVMWSDMPKPGPYINSMYLSLSIYIYLCLRPYLQAILFANLPHPSNSPSRRAKTISLIFLRCWRQDPTAFASALARRPGWVPRGVSESPYVWLRLEPWPWYVGASSFHAGCGSGTFGSPKK